MPEPLPFNAYSTLTSEHPPTFATQVIARSLHRDDGTLDPELQAHLGSMLAYVRSSCPDGAPALVDHIGHVWWHYQFQVPAECADDMAAWATDANAILYGPEAGLTDPSGRALMPPDEAAGTVPVTKVAIDRARAQRGILQPRGVAVPADIRPVRSEAETHVRPAREVALRALGVTLTAYFAGAVLTKHESQLNDDDMRRDYPLAFDAMSPREQEVFRTRDQDLARELQWGLVGAESLLWAVGQVAPRLPDASPSGADILAAAFPVGEEEFLAGATLRPIATLLDEAEREHELRGAADAGALGSSGFQARVITGRDRALTWLVDPRLAWDEIA